ncbi:Exportin-6 [Borealophlyctis nickersoniae]|nr:Exportin-6 [Borealophlyctis nickersoniae]
MVIANYRLRYRATKQFFFRNLLKHKIHTSKEWSFMKKVPYEVLDHAISGTIDARDEVITRNRERIQDGGPLHRLDFLTKKKPRQTITIRAQYCREPLRFYLQLLHNRDMVAAAGPPNYRKKDGPVYRPPLHHERRRNNNKWPNEEGAVECDSKLTYDKKLRQWTFSWVYEMDGQDGEIQAEPTIAAIDPGVVNFLTWYSPTLGSGDVGNRDIEAIIRLCLHLDNLIGKTTRAPARKRISHKRAQARVHHRIKNLVDEMHKKTVLWLVHTCDIIVLPIFGAKRMSIRKLGRRLGRKTVRKMLTWAHARFRQRLLSKAEEAGVTDVGVLNALLQEFFEDQATSPHRKKEIESILTNFKKQPHAILFCQELLQHPDTSPYAAWYSLSVYEDLLPQWYTGSAMSPRDRLDCRTFLFDLLRERYQSLPPYVANKLSKLVVDIGRKEYPQDWPTFMHDIFALKDRSLILCLVLCKTVVDEFMSTRDDVSAARKAELKAHLLQEAPAIVLLALEVLTAIYDRCILAPPAFASPVDGLDARFGIGLHSPVKSPHSLHLPSIGISPSKGGFPTTPVSSTSGDTILHGGHISGDDALLCQLALDILHSLLAWIPLSDTLHVPQVLTTIFKFVQLNDDSTVAMGSMGMTCLNELMSRNYVPREFLTFLMLISQQVCELLRYLTDDSNGTPKIIGLDETYRMKFTEFLDHFVGKHIGRAEATADFPLNEFLILLFKFTFSQPPSESYVACLHIWDTFLEYIISKKATSRDDAQTAEYIRRYEDGLVSVAKEVGKRLQFTENGDQLRDIDDERDGEAESDWEKFFRRLRSVDVSAKTAELYPNQVLLFLFDSVIKHSDALLNIRDHGQAGALNDHASDMIAVACIFGRLSHLFTADFESNVSSATSLLERFIGLLALPHIRNPTPFRNPELLGACRKLLLFTCLALYIHWFAAYRAIVQQNEAEEAGFRGLLEPMVQLALSSLEDHADISLAASGLLCSITGTVKPNILDLPIIQQYLHVVHTESMSYPHATKVNVYKFITYMYVLPFGNVSDEEIRSRSSAFGEFSQGLFGPYQQLLASDLAHGPAQSKVKRQVRHAVEAMCAMMEAVGSEGTNAKEMVYSIVKPVIRPTISREEDFIPETLQLFLGILSRSGLKGALGTREGSEILDKFVLVLDSLVGDTSKSFEGMLPSIIAFCTNELDECVQDENIPIDEARSHFYSLVHKILSHHWRFFFGSHVNRLIGRSTSDTLHEDELRKLLQVIYKSFTTTNADIFRQNLSALQDLDSRYSMYSKDVFRETMLLTFVAQFLNCLLNKSHDLLREDIIAGVTKMILADVPRFREQLVPSFISTRCAGMSHEQQVAVGNYLNSIQDSTNCPELLGLLVNDYGYFVTSAEHHY